MLQYTCSKPPTISVGRGYLINFIVQSCAFLVTGIRTAHHKPLQQNVFQFSVQIRISHLNYFVKKIFYHTLECVLVYIHTICALHFVDITSKME